MDIIFLTSIVSLPWFIITVPVVLLLGYQLDILNLGDNVATALGARVRFLK